MQPYFLPYVGYWQLLAMVDHFVVYDNIEYTKKGWINRNQFLQNGKATLFTVPLRKGPDHAHIVERSVAEGFDRDRLLNQLSASYRKAPFFAEVFPMLEGLIRADLPNLFDYLCNSIRVTADFLEISTPILKSSTLNIDHSLRAEEKVLALCHAVDPDSEQNPLVYINSMGGQPLYSRDTFKHQGIELRFYKTRSIEYDQGGGSFIPSLSIVDVMMFNSRDAIRAMLDEYDLI